MRNVWESAYKEETGFAIVDLIKLSQDQMVIADVGISSEMLWCFCYETCIYAVLQTFQIFSKRLSV